MRPGGLRPCGMRLEEEEEEEEEEECFYSTIQCNTMIRIKDIYREQFGQETPIKMQLASLSWEPPTEQTKYIMPTRDI